ncbi:MAG: ABC transporter substrate-binding protein [Desulfotalea sp.]
MTQNRWHFIKPTQAKLLSRLLLSPYILIFLIVISISTVSRASEPEEIRLYIDADFTNAQSSSISIEQGIKTALSEEGNMLGGYPVQVVRKDHRGNTRRSRNNLVDYINDDRALAVFCGLHSPPVLANLEYINTMGVLLLDPWAAAGPITRYPVAENWVFRLSVDDSKAGFVMVEHAIEQRGFNRLALLLEETGWGKSNEKTMTKALQKYGMDPEDIFWFNWGLKERGARMILRAIHATGADAILMVANAPEAKVFSSALLSLDESMRIPIVSHWGLTGGNFPQIIPYEQRQFLDLSFLQTKFSFVSSPENIFGQQVLQKARTLYPESINVAGDIQAPSGFIHAYDLTRLLIAAIKENGITGRIKEDRQRIRNGLEHLKQPVKGLVKTYISPFQPYLPGSPDAHEALGAEDLTMGKYNEKNEIILIDRETL